ARALDGAPEDQPSRVAGKVALFQPGRQIYFKLGGELRPLRAFSHDGGGAAAADEELDRVHQDRLAGAGLAGEHGEAALELQARGLDDDGVAEVARATPPIR